MAEQVSEISEEQYIEEKLLAPNEYQPKTIKGKKSKEKRDSQKETVKIAERMVDVSNCEKKVRAIAVKEKRRLP